MPLLENKCTKIDLRSLKWSLLSCSFTHGTILFSSAGILQTCKTVSLPPQPATQMREFHLSRGVVRVHVFSAYRGGKCSCDNVKQCVLTILLSTPGMSSRKSSHLEGLLMYCDSCCQQFGSPLSSCNFQPSPLHWYHFKSLLTICHTEAAGSIECLLWFGCSTFCGSRKWCFQNGQVAQGI